MVFTKIRWPAELIEMGTNKESSGSFPFKIVFLSGVDGCGKTTLTHKVIEILNSKGIPAVHVWSRFNNYLSKPLLAFARVLGLNYYEVRNGVKTGYHDFEKCKVISCLFISLQLIDVWIASIIRFWIPIIKHHRVIVSDRGPYDTLIDVALDTGMVNLPNSLFGRLFCWSIPFPHKTFLLVRDKNRIELSRPDVKYDRKFEKRMNLYVRNESTLAFQRVSNNNSIDHSISQILNTLFYEKKEATELDI